MEPYLYICNERDQVMPRELIFLFKWCFCILEYKMTCTIEFNDKEKSNLVSF